MSNLKKSVDSSTLEYNPINDVKNNTIVHQNRRNETYENSVLEIPSLTSSQ